MHFRSQRNAAQTLASYYKPIPLIKGRDSTGVKGHGLTPCAPICVRFQRGKLARTGRSDCLAAVFVIPEQCANPAQQFNFQLAITSAARIRHCTVPKPWHQSRRYYKMTLLTRRTKRSVYILI